MDQSVPKIVPMLEHDQNGTKPIGFTDQVTLIFILIETDRNAGS